MVNMVLTSQGRLLEAHFLPNLCVIDVYFQFLHRVTVSQRGLKVPERDAKHFFKPSLMQRRCVKLQLQSLP
jgi:hypothetical protein